MGVVDSEFYVLREKYMTLLDIMMRFDDPPEVITGLMKEYRTIKNDPVKYPYGSTNSPEKDGHVRDTSHSGSSQDIDGHDLRVLCEILAYMTLDREKDTGLGITFNSRLDVLENLLSVEFYNSETDGYYSDYGFDKIGANNADPDNPDGPLQYLSLDQVKGIIYDARNISGFMSVKKKRVCCKLDTGPKRVMYHLVECLRRKDECEVPCYESVLDPMTEMLGEIDSRLTVTNPPPHYKEILKEFTETAKFYYLGDKGKSLAGNPDSIMS